MPIPHRSLLLQSGVEPDLPAGADQRVHIHFTSGSCMTMKPLAAPPAAATVRSSSSTGDAQVVAESSSQHTEVVIVANIETGMAYVPEAIIQFVLRVSLWTAVGRSAIIMYCCKWAVLSAVCAMLQRVAETCTLLCFSLPRLLMSAHMGPDVTSCTVSGSRCTIELCSTPSCRPSGVLCCPM
eukprot:GHUV01035111.1.p1 GENE.GHUV01035111.1~~GHUV01035111.1.p1  ORF type:complete len:182 (+),score=31.75 GHUV01035111.1:438-983(+)